VKYPYQAEKFAKARRALMLPHPIGQADSIARAFHECHLGLHRLDRRQLDDNARDWLVKLDRCMDTSGLADRHSKGLWQIKAETLTESEKMGLSQIVDELAHWFDDQYHDEL
jgi:hypothetical protein